MPSAELNEPNGPVIVIAGPTASGKSGLALALAEHLNGIIINADSMQIYKHIPILSAMPTPEERAHIPHKLYGIYDENIRGNVVDWLNLCEKEITGAASSRKLPIVTGGTGMYLEALTEGTTPIPETPDEIRKQVNKIYRTEGLTAIEKLVRQYDPETAVRLNPNDTTRLLRAAEIWLHTGKSLSYWHSLPLIRRIPEDSFFRICIKPPRDMLNRRIRKRFDIMMQQGALTEAERLIKRNLSDSLPAMRALGVQELKAFLQKKYTLEEAVELAKIHSRQYAKRQMTWFNNRFSPDITLNHCFNTDETESKNFIDEIVDNLKKRYKILA